MRPSTTGRHICECSEQEQPRQQARLDSRPAADMRRCLPLVACRSLRAHVHRRRLRQDLEAHLDQEEQPPEEAPGEASSWKGGSAVAREGVFEGMLLLTGSM
jgi:hypothetical protein